MIIEMKNLECWTKPFYKQSITQMSLHSPQDAYIWRQVFHCENKPISSVEFMKSIKQTNIIINKYLDKAIFMTKTNRGSHHKTTSRIAMENHPYVKAL